MRVRHDPGQRQRFREADPSWPTVLVLAVTAVAVVGITRTPTDVPVVLGPLLAELRPRNR